MSCHSAIVCDPLASRSIDPLLNIYGRETLDFIGLSESPLSLPIDLGKQELTTWDVALVVQMLAEFVELWQDFLRDRAPS